MTSGAEELDAHLLSWEQVQALNMVVPVELAVGQTACGVCRVDVRLHPLDPEFMSHETHSGTRVVCDGSRIKPEVIGTSILTLDWAD